MVLVLSSAIFIASAIKPAAAPAAPAAIAAPPPALAVELPAVGFENASEAEGEEGGATVEVGGLTGVARGLTEPALLSSAVLVLPFRFSADDNVTGNGKGLTMETDITDGSAGIPPASIEGALGGSGNRGDATGGATGDCWGDGGGPKPK
jgi:hypothetical protein